MMKYRMHLLIDGYNLVHAMKLRYGDSLQDRREKLLAKLHDYQVTKKFEMTVVFDAADSDTLSGNRDKFGNIEIIYSGRNISADEVIVDFCRRRPGEYVVVTNDNEIIDRIEMANSLSLTSDEFSSKVQRALRELDRHPYEEDKEDSGPLYPRVTTKKKGRARRLPKKARRKQNQLKNL